ncbi:hypothetical protein HELRODRAFT_172426 [Helobdella robusta]|uniref:MSP domain-containing protein n=1 Tax=Helobdella robusta TaxID=6412 RepID=T1F5B3_HELRO|nr:hypothetical protein HELRODRAFT_172426 [Helobdella robusta]ESO04753.1 hypothetical protein HELRODRAFT_172426 [Helobdella robusta]
MKICTYDSLYQDFVVAHNRYNKYKRVTFTFPTELANHMEVLPSTAIVQSSSSFKFFIKFLPRKMLASDAPSYFDASTSVLRVPISVHVSDQTQPHELEMHAVVTTSDVIIEPRHINFNYCTTYERVSANVTAQNSSLLPQNIGFVDLPPEISVQPNDGFMTMLPMEKMEVCLTFAPAQQKHYKFSLVCKNFKNKDFKLTCEGWGVVPPVQLSHQLILLQLVAVDDHRELLRVSYKPRLHELSIKQEAARLMQVEMERTKQQQMTKRRSLTAENITGDTKNKKSATRAAAGEAAAATAANHNDDKRIGGSGGDVMKAGGGEKIGGGGGGDSDAAPTYSDVVVGNSEYMLARISLMKRMSASSLRHKFPCYIGCRSKREDVCTPVLDPNSTIYLEVHCSMMPPELQLVNDLASDVVEFGHVFVGHYVIRTLVVRNVSGFDVQLGGSLLDTHSNFSVLNSWRCIKPDETHNCRVKFEPKFNNKVKVMVIVIMALIIIVICMNKKCILAIIAVKPDEFELEIVYNLDKEFFDKHDSTPVFFPKFWILWYSFYESLTIKGHMTSLHVTLKGEGRCMKLEVPLVDRMVDFGKVMVGERVEELFKITNRTDLPLKYAISIDGQSKYKDHHVVNMTSVYGVFDCTPCHGVLAAGKAFQDILVSCQADVLVCDVCDVGHIVTSGQEEMYTFRMRCQVKGHTFYLEGGDFIHPSLVHSFSLDPPLPAENEDGDAKEATATTANDIDYLQPIIIKVTGSFDDDDEGDDNNDGCNNNNNNHNNNNNNKRNNNSGYDNDLGSKVKVLTVGCVKLSKSTKFKKNVEWYFEDMQSALFSGFSISPTKGIIESGHEQQITISWKPNASTCQVNKPCSSEMMMIMKGDVVGRVKVHLIGVVK